MERLVGSKNASTHSFTIMPIFTAAGDIKSPMYVVLQEPDGKFGPIVSKSQAQRRIFTFLKKLAVAYIFQRKV